MCVSRKEGGTNLRVVREPWRCAYVRVMGRVKSRVVDLLARFDFRASFIITFCFLLGSIFIIFFLKQNVFCITRVSIRHEKYESKAVLTTLVFGGARCKDGGGSESSERVRSLVCVFSEGGDIRARSSDSGGDGVRREARVYHAQARISYYEQEKRRVG